MAPSALNVKVTEVRSPRHGWSLKRDVSYEKRLFS